MEIASKIDPCPLVEVIMEVRFSSKVDEGAVFGIIFNQFKNDFEKTLNLPALELPPKLRESDPKLQFLPHYRLHSKNNKNVLLHIGPKVFSLIITNEYPGWPEFLSRIEDSLQKLEKSEVVSTISRFALRYVNFFTENILTKSNLSILLNHEELNKFNSNLRFEIPDGEFLNVLSISNNAIRNEEGKVVKGSTIDIDTIIQKDIPDFFTKRTALLNQGHSVEKKLFYSLLSEDYKKTLKVITYD